MPVKSNISQVLGSLSTKLFKIPDKVSRLTVASIYAEMSQRIFNDGENATNNKFGFYSPKYYELRKRKFNRSNRNINLVATGETERSLLWGDYGKGYAIGFPAKPNGSETNPNAAEKALSMTKRYGKIFVLSAEELKKMQVILNFELKRYMNGKN